MNLTRDTIVATALDIVDAYGLPDLTMRRLAATLEVQPSALYWHFSSKQDLLAAIADVIVPHLPLFTGGDLTRLQLWAARFHALLTQHRNGAELVWSVLCLRKWEDGVAYPIEQGLIALGLNRDTAHGAAAGLLHLVLGQAFDDDQRRQAIQLKVAATEPSIDASAALDDAVALLVAGLRTKLPAAPLPQDM